METGSTADTGDELRALSLSTSTIDSPMLTPTSTSGTHRYGALCSAYDALDPATLPLLERAILYTNVRAFTQSLAIFTALPADQVHLPVVAYEHAVTHIKQWTLLDAAGVLRDALAWAEENVGDYQSPGIYTLLRLYLAVVEVLTLCDFTSGKESMRETKNWLATTPIQEYTDIQVRVLSCSLFEPCAEELRRRNVESFECCNIRTSPSWAA